MSVNPLRLLRNLFADFLIWSSGTWVGVPDDGPWDEAPPGRGSGDDRPGRDDPAHGAAEDAGG